MKPENWSFYAECRRFSRSVCSAKRARSSGVRNLKASFQCFFIVKTSKSFSRQASTCLPDRHRLVSQTEHQPASKTDIHLPKRLPSTCLHDCHQLACNTAINLPTIRLSQYCHKVLNTVETRFMGTANKGFPHLWDSSCKSHFLLFYFFIFMIPLIRDPLIRKSRLYGMRCLVPWTFFDCI